MKTAFVNINQYKNTISLIFVALYKNLVFSMLV